MRQWDDVLQAASPNLEEIRALEKKREDSKLSPEEEEHKRALRSILSLLAQKVSIQKPKSVFRSGQQQVSYIARSFVMPYAQFLTSTACVLPKDDNSAFFVAQFPVSQFEWSQGFPDPEDKDVKQRDEKAGKIRLPLPSIHIRQVSDITSLGGRNDVHFLAALQGAVVPTPGNLKLDAKEREFKQEKKDDKKSTATELWAKALEDASAEVARMKFKRQYLLNESDRRWTRLVVWNEETCRFSEEGEQDLAKSLAGVRFGSPLYGLWCDRLAMLSDKALRDIKEPVWRNQSPPASEDCIDMYSLWVLLIHAREYTHACRKHQLIDVDENGEEWIPVPIGETTSIRDIGDSLMARVISRVTLGDDNDAWIKTEHLEDAINTIPRVDGYFISNSLRLDIVGAVPYPPSRINSAVPTAGGDLTPVAQFPADADFVAHVVLAVTCIA